MQSITRFFIQLKLNSLNNLIRIYTSGTNLYPLYTSIHVCPDCLYISFKFPFCPAGYFTADSTFSLCQTSTLNLITNGSPFTTNLTASRHFKYSPLTKLSFLHTVFAIACDLKSVRFRFKFVLYTNFILKFFKFIIAKLYNSTTF